MTTVEILQKLHGMAEAPWNDLRGKPLNDRGLATRLRQYSVKSRTLNLGGEARAKGYAREDLHDVWKCYLAPPPPSPDTSVTSVTSVPRAYFQGSEVTDVTQTERSGTDNKIEENADKTSKVTGVTDVTHMARNRGNDPGPILDCLLRAPSNSFRPRSVTTAADQPRPANAGIGRDAGTASSCIQAARGRGSTASGGNEP
jgi:Protein of unknown function (DUF3631)